MKRWQGWLIGFWVVSFSIAWIVSFVAYPDRVLVFGFDAIIFLVVGGFLTTRVRGNLIGPLLLGGASFALIYDVARAYAITSIEGRGAWPGEYVAAWLGAWTGPISFLTLPVLFLLFPEGRFAGRRRWFLPLFAAVIVSTLFGAAQLWGIPAVDLVSAEEGGRLHRYPEYDIFGLIFPLTLILALPAGVSLLLRYRKAGPEQRQQIKWLAASVILAPALGFAAAGILPALSEVIGVGAISMFPLAVAVAVLRYRLYDLGRVVSRTVTYTVVAALLAALFALAVVVIPNAIAGDEAPAWLVAGSTLAAAAAFNPLRRGVQRIVDRRFHRSRYDAGLVIDSFSASLRDRVDVEEVVRGWVGTVERTMQPSRVGVWLRR